jgi:hypothetical protein
LVMNRCVSDFLTHGEEGSKSRRHLVVNRHKRALSVPWFRVMHWTADLGRWSGRGGLVCSAAHASRVVGTAEAARGGEGWWWWRSVRVTRKKGVVGLFWGCRRQR